MNESEFLEDIIGKAGRSLKRDFGKALPQKEKSGKGDFVTEADLRSEKIIISAIEKNFPRHNILAEEAGELDQGSESTWIIDPLDGTRNYDRGIPIWGVAIALARKREIVLGAVYDPVHNELFLAKKGQGARLNGQKINVSDENEADDMMYGIGLVRHRISIDEYKRIDARALDRSSYRHVWGSAVKDLSDVATGRLDMFILAGCYPWDVAAAGLLIEEAGGKITDIRGRKWDPFHPLQEVVASNGKIHDEVLKIIKTKN